MENSKNLSFRVLPEIALALATAARTGREASRGGVEELESGKSPSSREFCLLILTTIFFGTVVLAFLPAPRRILGRIISAGSLESASSSSENDFLSVKFKLLTSFSTEEARELSIETSSEESSSKPRWPLVERPRRPPSS